MTTSTNVSATLPPGYTVPTTAESATTASTSGVNANTFLQLLVAQLKYQDPSNPTDSTQFLTQTATFQEVEQLTNMQTAMSSLLTQEQNTSATSLLGQNVTATDSNGNPITGTVTSISLGGTSGPTLTVNGLPVAMSSVTGVSQAASTGQTTSTNSGTTA